jgi:dolichyl-phosphate beta-glucosyltransferase
MVGRHSVGETIVSLQRTIVVPCFNEATRLDVAALARLAGLAQVTVLAVDDGSTDDTPRLLADAAQSYPGAIAVRTLARNHGKGEAVRRGLLEALMAGADVAGYYDADLSTPVDEMSRLIRVLDEHADLQAVLGARVAMLGHEMHRRAWRHYLGRVFATMSSAALRLPVYDTQCGAKVFRAGPALQRSLAEPFNSRWAFDVELLGRLRSAGVQPEGFLEVPLREWRDVRGSKLRPASALVAGADLVRLAVSLRRTSRAKTPPVSHVATAGTGAGGGQRDARDSSALRGRQRQ